jgi:hypothetical protein
MEDYDKAILWLEDAILETDKTLQDCSLDLKTQLIEQRNIFSIALTALRTLKIAQEETARLMEKLQRRSVFTGMV